MGSYDDRQGCRCSQSYNGGVDQRSNEKADHGANKGLADDDLVDIEIGRTDRAQGCEFDQMFLGAGIKCLGNNDRSHDNPEESASEQGSSRTCTKQPEPYTAVTKFRGRQNLNIGNVC